MRDCYKYEGDQEKSWMIDMLLSPRGSFSGLPSQKRSGYVVCSRCKNALHNREVPSFSIGNGCAYGTPPPELLELTDVELAFLTPVKTYGYCFTFTGGKQTCLKGTLAYYKVKIGSIARAVAHLDALSMNQHVVVLITGKMTEQQRRTARKKAKVQTSKLLGAVEWLSKNNIHWKDVDIAALSQELQRGP